MILTSPLETFNFQIYQIEMSSTSATKINATLFLLKGADNYFKWASTMKAYFMVQGLWKIVKGETIKPVLTKVPKVDAVLGGTSNSLVLQIQKPETDNQDKIDKWEEDGMQANGILILYVDLEIHKKYQKDTSAEMWEAIWHTFKHCHAFFNI